MPSTGWDEDALAALRAAAHRGDGAGGVELLACRELGPVLQYAGDVLVAALGEGVPGAGPLARACLGELDGRGAPGDAELAAEVAAALGEPRRGGESVPPWRGGELVPLPVDLGAVAAALEAGEPHVLDLVRGDVLGMEEAEGDEGRWLPIPPGGVLDAREEARRGLARAWLARHGLRSAPRTL